MNMKTIKQLREEAGLTQLDLAYKLGVTPATVSLWERRRVEPKASQIRALALLFETTMDQIAFESDPDRTAKIAA